MKTKIFWMALAAVLLSGTAHAGVIKGEVTSLDTVGQTVDLKVLEENREDKIKRDETIHVAVSADTQFEGADFTEYRVGDILLADVRQGAAPDVWIAQKVQIDKVNVRNKQEMAQSSKNSTEI